MHKVDFFFDYLSPYSYFAWLNRHKINNVDLYYRPLAMGSLFNHWEMKGPGQIKPKREYMLKQCFIYAAQNNIDFIPPKTHPFNPLYALRLSTYAIESGKQEELIDALWKSVWAKGLDISDTDLLTDLLKKLSLNADELMEKSFNPEVKKEIKDNFKLARENGIFGVPSFRHEENLFWGNDSIDLLNKSLNKELPEWDEELYKERLGLT